jgi:hypothetical protein
MSDATPLFLYTGVTCERFQIYGSNLDIGKDIRFIFCDISKAFDRVWHTGLLYKLRKIGIDGNLLSWATDYLDERKQKVVLDGF